jgi:hypothetical protein
MARKEPYMGMFRKGVMVAVLTVAIAAMAVPAQAVSLTTLFASNNSHTGNMFDVSVFASDITITSLAVSLEAGANTSIEVWIKSGTYVGFEETQAAWTMVSSTAGVVSAGVDAATFVDVTDFALSSGTMYGMYVTATDFGVMNYTNDVATYSNADLQLDLGVGIGHPRFTTVFSPRTWNGTINYELGASNPVPEPGTLALFGFGLAAGAGRLRRKFGKKS